MVIGGEPLGEGGAFTHISQYVYELGRGRKNVVFRLWVVRGKDACNGHGALAAGPKYFR